jgi:hypothetical protein
MHTHYFSLFDFLMANWNWATILVVSIILGIGGRGATKS